MKSVTIYYRTGAHVRVCLAFFREVGWSEEGRDESSWDEVGEREREQDHRRLGRPW